jgi:hypothetical protein
MKSRIIAALMSLGLLALVAPGTALAGSVSGTAVNVTLNPHSSYGTYGGIQVQVGSQYIYFCSKNATSTSCTSNTGFLYSEAQLMTLARMLRDAMDAGRTLNIWTDDARPSGGNTVEFSRY